MNAVERLPEASRADRRQRLLPFLGQAPARVALRMPDGELSYDDLRRAAIELAAGLEGMKIVGVWAQPRRETVVGIAAAIAAGVLCVPINPKAGPRELVHVVADSDPDVVLAAPDAELPPELQPRRLDARCDGAPTAPPAEPPPEPPDESPALLMYTSGTTGPPKGVLLPRRAMAASIDVLADAWRWTEDDVMVHGLPLFHGSGLLLATLGALRVGCTSMHMGSFSPEATARTLRDGTMLLGVPTMYRRLADAAERDGDLRAALGSARLLLSGAAALPKADHERLERVAGARVFERYGMTETTVVAATRLDGERRAGYVGAPLPGVEVRFVGDGGRVLDICDDSTIGEIEVRGRGLFLGYHNQPEATAAATHDGWFRTGDLATRSPDGQLRILGRSATDLIKSGGYKIGAGEVEAALREHPDVEEAAVAGRDDADLGQRIVAWVIVREGARPQAQALIDHVAVQLTPHKRPREIRFVDDLPRNALGKIQKAHLADVAGSPR